MSFEKYQEWLARKLSHADDTGVGAGGTSLKDLQKDVQARTVTPAVLSGVPTEVGRVVRYIREQRGWSRRDMSNLASIDEVEVDRIETLAGYEPAPRTLMNLADLCGFSPQRFQQLARHIVMHQEHTIDAATVPFAAQSRHPGSISHDEFEAIRVLIEVLSEKAAASK